MVSRSGPRSLTVSKLASRLRYQLTGPKKPRVRELVGVDLEVVGREPRPAGRDRQLRLRMHVEEAGALHRRRSSASSPGHASPDAPHRIDAHRAVRVGARARSRPDRPAGSRGCRRSGRRSTHLHQVRRRHRATGRTARCTPTTGAHPVGVQPGHLPHDERAPVVADEDRRRRSRGDVEQPEQVGGQVLDAVGLDLRSVRVECAVAALVGRDHVVAGIGERLDLVSPRVGELGEAVAQHDRWGRPGRRPRSRRA